jgi:Tol biopolymer transport system component
MPGRMAAAAGSWNRDDVIVFAASGPDGNEGLMRVPASGGTPVLVTRTNRSREVGHGNPIFLPDGRHFLYQSMTSRGAGNVRVASLDVGPDAQQDPPVLELASGRALFAATPDGRAGHVLFMRQGKLMSQTFDINRLQPVGEATVVPNQPSNEIASREFAPSPTILVYRRLIQPNGTLTWVDRRGREESVLGGAVLTGPDFPRFSPDGRHLALVLGGDVWIQDLGGRPPLRLTFNGSSLAPLWTPDGRRVVFETLERLESIAADGSEQTPTPASGNGHYHAHGWSSDGTALIAVRFVGPVPHIVSITPGGDDNFQPLVPSFGRTGENGVALSPDGRWLAYASDATGREEVWVQAYPGPGPPIRVSAAGGVEPVWARSGRELFYREGPRMMSVKVQSSSTAFEAQPAVPLFAGTYLRNGQPPSYDVAADGRFLMIKPSGETDAPIAAIVNWSGASGGQ